MFTLTEEQQCFADTVKKFVAKEVRPYVEKWEEEGKTPRSLWKRCGELGFLGLSLPEDVGGQGADHIYNFLFHYHMAQCGSSGVALGISVQTDMATPALARYGNDFLKQEYLKGALKGDLISSIAVSEPNAGSDVVNIRTTAVKDGDDYIINGQKTFITNGNQADFLTLLARTGLKNDHQSLSLFVVPTNVTGFSVARPLKKTCYLSSDTAEINLDQVRVSKDHLIGQENHGFKYQMEQFQFERLAACALSFGTMERCLHLTKKYTFERSCFGRPLNLWQVTKHKLAQMFSEVKMVEAFSAHCLHLANQKRDFTKEVSMLKLVAAQIQQRVAEECAQLHGGYGLMSEYEVARYFRDSKLMSIGGGTNEVMKEIIAKYEGLELNAQRGKSNDS